MRTSALESVYTVLLVASLVLNGVAVAGAVPLRTLFAPLRDPRPVLSALVLDLLIAPLLILLPAVLLRLDPHVYAGLVLIAASSTGPIGIVLVRIAGADLRLGVSLVTLFGVANLVTIPVLTTLLLPATVPLPVLPVLLSLVTLILLPLLAGRGFSRLSARMGWSRAVEQRVLGHLARASTILLAGAVLTAAFLDLEGVLRLLAGPITPIVLLSLIGVVVGARLVGRSRAERLTVGLVISARGAGVALAVAGLHLADAPDTRAAILAVAGVTQLLPLLAAIAAGRRRRVPGGSPG